ncbi:MAG: hypothetical protein FWB82_03740 [Treponema sp.]|nr:hypothetical protein [Treponema sp.]MCL2205614.1 hypothetical protein [Treponema sp.]
MRRFFFLCALLALNFSVGLSAQAGTTSNFPFALVLNAAEFTSGMAGIWQADWPLYLPPDAFRVLHGDVSAITLTGGGFADEFSLAFRQDENGNPHHFPFMFGGRMAQVRLYFLDDILQRVTVHFPISGEVMEFEILEHQNLGSGEGGRFKYAYPSLVRANIGGSWFFITLSRWSRGITETWFGEGGNFVSAYFFSLDEEPDMGLRIRYVRDFSSPGAPFARWYFDSWGMAMHIADPAGDFSVLRHLDALPRYWERQTTGGGGGGSFYLQWDAQGFLVRMTEGIYADAALAGFESRFEYTLDEQGNWITRQEILVSRQEELLFFTHGTVFTRVLEYARHE